MCIVQPYVGYVVSSTSAMLYAQVVMACLPFSRRSIAYPGVWFLKRFLIQISVNFNQWLDCL